MDYEALPKKLAALMEDLKKVHDAAYNTMGAQDYSRPLVKGGALETNHGDTQAQKAYGKALAYCFEIQRSIEDAGSELQTYLGSTCTRPVEPRYSDCCICGIRVGDQAGGRCTTCYQWYRRHGTERPKSRDKGVDPIREARDAQQRRLKRGEPGY